ncbi:MAG: C10 family peptidase [Burkholderiales bacterium]
MHGAWGGESRPQVTSIRPLSYGSVTPAYLVSVAPSGFLLISQDDDLAPVPFYSERGRFVEERVTVPQTLESWLLPELADRLTRTTSQRVELEQTYDEEQINLLRDDSETGREWRFFNVDPEHFLPLNTIDPVKFSETKDKAEFATKVGSVLPGLTWDQGNSKAAPFTYNKFAPSINGTAPNICPRAVTGCVATAIAQVMRYWKWPARGTGTSSVTPAGGQLQTVNHDIAFDWDNMPPALEDEFGRPIASSSQINAVATLMQHVGFAVDMIYGCSGVGLPGSAAFLDNAQDALPRKFGYRPSIEKISRRSISYDAFFTRIKAEIDASPPRPVLLGIYRTGGGHAVVVDGYQIVGTSKELLLNMGWGGAGNGYYKTYQTWAATEGSTSRWDASTHEAWIGIQPDSGCSYRLASASFAAPAAGTTSTLAVTAGANCASNATTNVSWISVASPNGVGSRSISFSVAANTSATSRSGSIAVGDKTFVVEQPGNVSCNYSVSTGELNYTAAARFGAFSISTAPTCNWRIASSDAWVGANAWVTFVSPTSGAGSGTVSFSIAGNSGAARSTELLVGGQKVRISQAGTCAFSLDNSSQAILSSASNGQIEFTAGSNCAWTAVSSAAWLTLTRSSGTGSATIGYSASANSSSSPRTATVTIGRELFTLTQAAAGTFPTGISNGDFEQGVSMWSQQGAGPLIFADPGRARSGAGYAWLGGDNQANDVLSQTFFVPSNASSVSLSFWYRIRTTETTTTGAFDSLKVEVWNSAGSTRLASLQTLSNLNASSSWRQIPALDLSSFRGQTIRLVIGATTDPSNITDFFLDDFALSVGGSTCTYSVTPSSRSVTSAASSVQYSVTTSPAAGCPWSATTSSSWLTVALGTNKSGSDTFIVVADENTTGAPRSGSVTVGGQTVVVNQAGPAAVPSVSNASGVLRNPDFEQGPAFWSEVSSGGFALIGNDVVVPAKSGSSYGRLGGYRNANDVLSQTVNIPANATGAVLSFWYRVRTDKATSSALDFAEARLVDPETGEYLTLDSVSNLDATNEWLKSDDYVASPEQVAQFKGKSVRFELRATTDGGPITAFYIDDIRADITVSNAAAASSLLKRGGIDIDGDGRGEIVVRSPTGGTFVGRLSGSQMTYTQIADPGPNYSVMGAVDLDSKGRSDMIMLNLAQGDSGEARVWSAFNAAIPKVLRNVRTAWRVDAVGDLDGDGRGDIVWRFTGIGASPNDTGVSYIWFTDGNGVTQVRKRGGAPLSWTLLGAIDLNSDGAADMIYVSPDLQVRALMATPNRTCANLSGGSQEAGFTALALGSFSGLGKGEILARNAAGQVQLVQLDARGISLPPYTGLPDDPNASCTGSSISIPRTITRPTAVIDPSYGFLAATDLNGDGITDIVWRRLSDGAVIIWIMGAGGQVGSTLNGGNVFAGYDSIQR